MSMEHKWCDTEGKTEVLRETYVNATLGTIDLI
jgi:hypothetical protein